MEDQPKRPISVWIAQVLLMLFSILFLLPILMLPAMLIGNPGSFSIFGLLLAMVIYCSIVVVFQVGFWGMVRRRAYGRWIGVGVLLMFVAMSIIGQFTRPNGPFEYYEYENATEAVAGFMTQVVIVVLLLSLTATLAFGSRVAVFFSRPDDAELSVGTDDSIRPLG